MDREGRRRRQGTARRRKPGGALAFIVGLVLAGLLAVGGSYLLYSNWPLFGPSCDVENVGKLASAGSDKDALRRGGTACIQAGIRNGSGEAMVAGVRALRVATEQGSAEAALEFAKLFDPLERPDLEAAAAKLVLLPRPDGGLALRYYDLAAATIPEARDLAVRLRAGSSMPGTDGVQIGGNGLPLAIPGYPQLYQRVLARPEATLAPAPDAAGRPVPIFDIFYVFERRPGWLKVGRSLERGPEGWMPEDKAQEWRAMLAMKYLDKGARSPAVFFRDDVVIRNLLDQPGSAERLQEMMAAAERDDPASPIVAMEDQSVDWANSRYMMPILDAAPMPTRDGRNIYLAKVASVAMPGTRALPSNCSDDARDAGSIRNEVVFVIDTTMSMGPYIEGVKRIASEWRRRIESQGLDDQFRFGVIAYRNNMDTEPQRSQLGYVVQPVLPLSPQSTAAQFEAAVQKLAPATVTTHSFSEDAVAGLETALSFGWSGCGTRSIFLVTDAGALAAGDPKAKLGSRNFGLVSVAQLARNAGINIYPVHIQTPEARQAGNVDVAAGQYRTELAPAQNYTLIRDGSTGAFANYYKGIGQVIDSVLAARRGRPMTAPAGDEAGSGKLILNALFAAQQRFVGALAGATAPTFAATWTSDSDLAQPNRQTLMVAALLTRRELSELAAQTQYLIQAATAGQTESSRFFSLMQMVSAATTQDPRRFGAESSRIGDMLPAFLKLLPYRSAVLELTADEWRDMQAQRQQSFIDQLKQKLEAYRRIETTTGAWVSLGAGGDPGEAIALVPLKDLP